MLLFLQRIKLLMERFKAHLREHQCHVFGGHIAGGAGGEGAAAEAAGALVPGPQAPASAATMATEGKRNRREEAGRALISTRTPGTCFIFHTSRQFTIWYLRPRSAWRERLPARLLTCKVAR